MTIYIGSNSTAGLTNLDNYTSSSGTREYVRLLVASASGSVVNLWLKVNDLDGNSIKLTLRDSSGVLLGVTAAISTLSSGWAHGAITSVAVTSGTSYYLGYISTATSSVSLNTDTTFDADYSTSGTYASPASTITGIVDDNGYHRYQMYAESATPATLSTPVPSGILTTATTATIGATTDQTSGTLYCVVDTSGNLSGVTGAQIKLGQKNNSTSAFKSGSVTISTTTPAIAITGLATNTTYSYSIVQNNANGDTTLSSGTFTTSAFKQLTLGNFQSNETNVPTSTFSASANKLILFCITSTNFLNNTLTAAPTSVVGLDGLSAYSMVKVASVNNTTTGINTSLWRMLISSPGTGRLFTTFPATTSVGQWEVIEVDVTDITGTNGANAIIQSVKSTDNNITTSSGLTLTSSAFADPNNSAYAVFCGAVAGTPVTTGTPDSGWTESSDYGQSYASNAASITLETQTRASSDTTASVTWSNGVAYSQGISIEIKTSLGSATLEQEGFRWRDDDGSETSATWLASQDTAITRGTNVNTRIRYIINATNNPESANYKLQYRAIGDPTWKDIT